MTSIFDYTILANLTSVAIVIIVYVFFATIKGSSVKRSEEGLIKVIENRNSQINDTLKELKENDQAIHRLNVEENAFNKQISKAQNNIRALSFKNMVLIPFVCSLSSIIITGIATIVGDNLQIYIWIVALILLGFTIFKIISNLLIIDEVSTYSDLNMSIEKAKEDILNAISEKVNITYVKPIPKDKDIIGLITVQEHAKQDINTIVESVLEELTDKERRMLSYYYGLQGQDKLSLSRIAKEWGIDEQSAWKMIVTARMKLRHPSRSMRLLKVIDTIPVLPSKRNSIENFVAGVFSPFSPDM
jgi:predicted DNA-binding protein YlxM (UPF0122 family)/uncharacterized protein YdcH (DUF465 family)